MTVEEFIRKAKQTHQYATVATVLRLSDNSTCDVEPINNEPEIQAVRYQSDGAKDGILIVPKIGSLVVVAPLYGTGAYYVAMFSEVESIVLLGGKNGGAVKVAELVQKLNTLESDLNVLKTAFKSWVTVPNDGGAALKAITATWTAQSITATKVEDLANDKLLH